MDHIIKTGQKVYSKFHGEVEVVKFNEPKGLYGLDEIIVIDENGKERYYGKDLKAKHFLFNTKTNTIIRDELKITPWIT